MKRKPRRKERRGAKSIQRLPDLEAAKSAVLNSLSCPDAQRGYRHAIDEFVEWYCSEPRLSFSKTVVLRYRMHLETRDRALLALLLACGLRRHELASLTVGHLQQREGHWAIVDLRGKGGTFGPFRSRIGCMAFWMTGQGPPELARAAFSGG